MRIIYHDTAGLLTPDKLLQLLFCSLHGSSDLRVVSPFASPGKPLEWYFSLLLVRVLPLQDILGGSGLVPLGVSGVISPTPHLDGEVWVFDSVLEHTVGFEESTAVSRRALVTPLRTTA